LFLFILESIGTSELILIAVIALIVFGPRKLPQMAKTIGKTMSEFRNATNEFKTTWEKEAAFEIDENQNKAKSSIETAVITENEAERNSSSNDIELMSFPAPKIKELSPEVIAQNFHNRELLAEAKIDSQENKIEKQTSEKRDWI
jgi:Tat protein translocase TatB subunit